VSVFAKDTIIEIGHISSEKEYMPVPGNGIVENKRERT
jgi:hypothetical protein